MYHFGIRLYHLNILRYILFDDYEFDSFLVAIATDGDIIDAVGGEVAVICVLRQRLGGSVLLDDTTIGVNNTDVDDVVVGLVDT